MDAGTNSNVRTCSELSAGEEIEAWHKGRLFHRGRVAETIPSTDLFWIVDSRTGARKLLDVEALEIVRVARTVPAEAVRADALRTEAVCTEAVLTETGHVEKVVRGERATAPRAPRREPHVVWFSSAG
ncbi:hypothetical protein FCN77_21125 [Arthrobacter sp. 24S4-2]|nr:hypothetical protein FCN77_21125 [Arthrobacter sp. 24S4-2]